MLYRKQKKWIEFILRLLPLFIILIYFIYYLLAYRNSGVISDIFASPESFMTALESITRLAFPYFANGPLYDILSSFQNVFSESIINTSFVLNFIFAMLAHNIICSLLFLFFDFIAFIIDFARRWLDGLYGKD